MNKYIASIIISFLGLGLASCTKTQDENPTKTAYGTQVKLPVSLNIAKVNGKDPFGTQSLTKAPKDIDDNTVFDVWLFQFNGTADNSKLVAPAQYLTGSEITDNISFIEGQRDHRIVAIVNFGSADFEWQAVPGVMTYKDLTDKHMLVNIENDSYFNKRILMSGYCDITVNSSANIHIPLKRSVAKVSLQITNNVAGLNILSAKMYSVPSRLDLFAGQVEKKGTYPLPSESDYIDYGFQEIPIATGESDTYVWYVPRNEMGKTVNGDARYKNNTAPTNATYIRVVAKNASNDIIAYKLYPGENMINDFNLKPNNHYEIGITINKEGNPEHDLRVENFATIDLADKFANSYILTPPPSGLNIPRVYKIYPKQVNLFWGDPEYAFRPPAMIGSKAAGNAQNWSAKVIWMDNPNMVTKTAGDGNIKLVLDPDTKGDDMSFSLEVPSTAMRGNFTVGFFKDANKNHIQEGIEPYIWTVHFWVTDYEPDMKVIINGTQYDYGVNGGALHRYSGDIWSTGIYKHAVIMDRDLGSLSPLDGNLGVNNRGQLYYQYGRQDPFPANITVYDEAGNDLGLDGFSNTKVGGPGSEITVLQAMANHRTFYLSPATSGDWSNDTESDPSKLKLWKDNKIVGSPAELAVSTAKSIYDPCPYGWQLPNKGTWDDYKINVTALIAKHPALAWEIGATKGLRYWPGLATDPVIASIFYSTSGFRDGQSSAIGALANVGTEVYRATSTPIDANTFVTLKSTSSSISKDTPFKRSMGVPVRCIKINAVN